MDPIEASPLGPAAARKLALRDQLVTARGRLGVAVLAERAALIRDALLAQPEVRHAATVAAYVAVGREPGTGPLLEALAAAGRRVLLPLLQPDGDLDWAAYAGPSALATAPRGLLEPTTPALGRDAVATADVVVVPGLAVDRRGLRLGRGGGSYDRALERATGWRVIALNSEEVLDQVPVEPHDRRVHAAATEQGVIRFGPPGVA